MTDRFELVVIGAGAAGLAAARAFREAQRANKTEKA